ncbi:unnamed protein product [Aspergillus oryzae]|nr:unnamed protein product [Aspergillus oryzae]GMF84497.1 unnamed protein product [Aspergillus oryzae]GMG11146.1 unnamed protein product [Aspergillus oryzae]
MEPPWILTADSPLAWASKPIKQDVPYSDTKGVQAALDKLQKLPPLVTTQEVCPSILPPHTSLIEDADSIDRSPT